jgi:hypothetical protein
VRNAMQLKAFIKKTANDKKISAQAVLQSYMPERLLRKFYHCNVEQKLRHVKL